MTEVILYLYDLSQGMAKNMSRQLLGFEVEYIPHTGIVVQGKEWYFGNGICQDPPGRTPFGNPVRTFNLGQTNKSQEDFWAHLQANGHNWNHSTYNIISHNCNNFTDFCSKYLLNNGIPQDIIELPQKVLNTPIGQQMLLPQLQRMQQVTNNAGHSMMGGMGGGGGNGGENGQSGNSDVVAQPEPIESSEEQQMVEPMLNEVQQEQNKQGKLDSFSVLNKVIKNIVKNPEEQKQRSIKKSNKKLNDALYSNETILTLMLMIGFEENEEAQVQSNPAEDMKLIQACQQKISKLIRPPFIDLAFAGKDLVLLNYENNKATTMTTSDVIGDKKQILLQFSAHWCPPCRKFTPILAEGQRLSSKKNQDIIFVSSDRQEGEQTQQIAEMPWWCLNFRDQTEINNLSKICQVQGIPMLVLMDRSGNIVDSDQRSKIQSGGVEVLDCL